MHALRHLVALCAIALLAGCQTTSFKSAWYDTTYTGGVLKKVVVIANDGTTANSRVFEDIFVQKFNAAGVTGIPGYRTVPPDTRGGGGALRDRGRRHRRGRRADGAAAARRHQDAGIDDDDAGSDVGAVGRLLRRPRLVLRRTDITQYDVATVESNLYDVKTKRLIWAATSDTINPTTVAKEAPNFADLLIAQFRARGLFPPAPK